MEVGCIVQNVGTAKAIYEAIAYKKPLIERVVTVTGAVNNPMNLMVRIGTPAKSLIEYCGGFSSTPAKVIVGGPMMGIAQYTLDIPVIKGTSGIVVLPEDGWQRIEEQPCINCGKCIEVCPMNLMPRQLDIYVRNGLWNKAQEIGILNCIECGSCAYVCPGGRSLVHSIRYGKFRVMESEKSKEKATKN
jgi:electron transport complex protein RnfC